MGRGVDELVVTTVVLIPLEVVGSCVAELRVDTEGKAAVRYRCFRKSVILLAREAYGRAALLLAPSCPRPRTVISSWDGLPIAIPLSCISGVRKGEFC